MGSALREEEPQPAPAASVVEPAPVASVAEPGLTLPLDTKIETAAA